MSIHLLREIKRIADALEAMVRHLDVIVNEYIAVEVLPPVAPHSTLTREEWERQAAADMERLKTEDEPDDSSSKEEESHAVGTAEARTEPMVAACGCGEPATDCDPCLDRDGRICTPFPHCGRCCRC